MSKFNYGKMQKVSKRLINRFGTVAIWVSVKQNDSDEPWRESGGVTETEHEVLAIFVPVERDKRENITWRENIEQRGGNELMYMAPVNFMPTGRDYVKRNGVVKRVKTLDRYAPGPVDKDVLYEIQLEL